MYPLLFDGRWYASAEALKLLSRMFVDGRPHLTPDGKVTMVFDSGGMGSLTSGGFPKVVAPALVPQGTDGQDLMTFCRDEIKPRRIEFKPEELPDLERMVEFDHIPEPRQDGPIKDGLHKPGDRLA